MFGALFGFNGRLSRLGFIECLLAIALVDLAAILISTAVGEYGLPGAYFAERPIAPMIARSILPTFGLLTLWSLLATTVKRCHDRNRSGWLALIVLIPAIGWLWLLIDLVLLKGTTGRNDYGRSPHGDPEPEPIAWQGELLRAPVVAETELAGSSVGPTEAIAPASEEDPGPVSNGVEPVSPEQQASGSGAEAETPSVPAAVLDPVPTVEEERSEPAHA